MARFQKRMEDCMDDRTTAAAGGSARQNSPSLRSIFEKSNETLNVVGGFADFAFSQAKSDIFGSAPYFNARPVGLDDKEKSDLINAHSNWKLGESNTQEGMEEALELAFHLGTAFPKSNWRRSEETYERTATILVDKKGQPVTGEDGEYLFNDADFDAEEMELDPAEHKFATMRIKETERYYDNVETECVDFRDIAWDATARSFDLRHTSVFQRCKPRLLDLAAQLDLTQDDINELRISSGLEATHEGGDKALEHRTEGNLTQAGITDEDTYHNPKIEVIECYARIDVLRDGNPVRCFAIICPALNRLLFIDYLACVTPEGRLPITPVRVYKVPGRVYGRGFHEKYEDVQDYIDAGFNAASYRNMQDRVLPFGIDNSKLMEDLEVEEGQVMMDFAKVWKLQPDAKIDEAFQTASAPDRNDGSVELSMMMVEFAQLRTGISSAAQGGATGLPQSNTATGVQSIMNRSATLLRWPITNAQKDLKKSLEYDVVLIYSNHDKTETFTWGEGRNAEVLSLSPAEVKGLEMDVVFELAQAQNEKKLEESNAGIQIGQSYVNLPEIEKDSQREMYVQSGRVLGFHDPEKIFRPAVLTYEDLLSQLPPELAQMLAANSQFHADQIAAAEGEGSQTQS